MGHINRHLEKTPEELIMRLMTEWKLFSGCLYNFVLPLIEKEISLKDIKERQIFILCFKEYVGYGYNRKFEKILSKKVKVVVENNEILTAYPFLEEGLHTREYFDFNEFEKIYDEEILNTYIFQLFLELIKLHKYEIQFKSNKNPEIKIQFGTKYSLKYKHNKITLIDNDKYHTNTYTYTLTRKLSKKEIVELLDDIDSFKPTYNIFGSITIDDIIKKRLSF